MPEMDYCFELLKVIAKQYSVWRQVSWNRCLWLSQQSLPGPFYTLFLRYPLKPHCFQSHLLVCGWLSSLCPPPSNPAFPSASPILPLGCFISLSNSTYLRQNFSLFFSFFSPLCIISVSTGSIKIHAVNQAWLYLILPFPKFVSYIRSTVKLSFFLYCAVIVQFFLWTPQWILWLSSALTTITFCIALSNLSALPLSRTLLPK